MKIVELHRGDRSMARLEFLWFDFWIGAFWDRNKRVLYVALIPCLVLVIPVDSWRDLGEPNR